MNNVINEAYINSFVYKIFGWNGGYFVLIKKSISWLLIITKTTTI